MNLKNNISNIEPKKESVADKLYDENENCKQCGHAFDPHILIAYDKENPTNGGIMKCPVAFCPCHHTWDFMQKIG